MKPLVATLTVLIGIAFAVAASAQTDVNRVFTSGYNNQVLVHGAFGRQGATNTWVETNNQGSNTFTAIRETPDDILLFDTTRNIFIDLNLAAKTVGFRKGADGSWVSLYTIESAGDLPNRVFMSGYSNQIFVNGTVQRQGASNDWIETNSQGMNHFTSARESSDDILLYDQARNLYLDLNLRAKTVARRLGDAGAWDPLYKIDSTDGQSAMIAQAEAQSPTQPSAQSQAHDHNERGVQFYNAGDYGNALAEFQQAVQLDPSNSVMANNLQNSQTAINQAQQQAQRSHVTTECKMEVAKSFLNLLGNAAALNSRNGSYTNQDVDPSQCQGQ